MDRRLPGLAFRPSGWKSKVHLFQPWANQYSPGLQKACTGKGAGPREQKRPSEVRQELEIPKPKFSSLLTFKRVPRGQGEGCSSLVHLPRWKN